MTALQLCFILMVVFQVKHFLADYPLQRGYMLRKGSPQWDFLLPLIAHCGIHAGLTLGICLVVRPDLWWLAIFDFTIHFFMDRIKSGPRYLGRFRDMSRAAYWNTFGLDQMVHHLTDIAIVWVIINS